MLGLLAVEITRRRRIGHQDELDLVVSGTIGQTQKGWLGGEMETSQTCPVAGSAGDGSGQVHGMT